MEDGVRKTASAVTVATIQAGAVVKELAAFGDLLCVAFENAPPMFFNARGERIDLRPTEEIVLVNAVRWFVRPPRA
jgi:hypothetical protein